MSTPVTLGLFAAGLALVFGAANVVGAAVGPIGGSAPAGHSGTTVPAPAGHSTARNP